MATEAYRIVSGDESDIHDEPHIAGSRITVRFVHERVEEGGVTPKRFSVQHDLDLADVYEALAYYHKNSDLMGEVEQRHDRAVAEAKRRSSVEPPE